MIRLSVLCAVLSIATTTLAQDPGPYSFGSLTTNNTAACSAPNYGGYCNDQFPATGWPYLGWADVQSNAVITVLHDPSPAGTWNVSKGRNAPPCLNCPDSTDMHSLMYGGSTSETGTKVVVETQSWFCNPDYTSSECDYSGELHLLGYQGSQEQDVLEYESHDNVQYSAWQETGTTLDSPTMDARTVDIWDRGGDIVAFDYYGGPQNCPPSGSGNFALSLYTNACPTKFQYADLSYQYMVYAIQNTLAQQRGTNATLGFYLQLDQGAWHKSTCPPPPDPYEPWCAMNKTIADIDYAYTGKNEGTTQSNNNPYLLQTQYSHSNGKRIIAFYQDEADDFQQCTSTAPCYFAVNGGSPCTSFQACFQVMYDGIRSHLNTLLGSNNFYMIFAYKNGCQSTQQGGGHVDSDGCYAWLQPYNQGQGNITDQNQRYDYSGGAKAALDGFYYFTVNYVPKTALNTSPTLIMGAAFKGFDDWMASWSKVRVTSQECGQTWLYSWKEMTWNGSGYGNGYYNPTTNPLNYMMVQTWDDYEEGTEIETGIGNCVKNDSTFYLTLSGNNLQWFFDFVNNPSTDPFAALNTIDHYLLYYTTDGTNYYAKAAINPAGAGCTTTSYPHIGCGPLNLSNYSWAPHHTYTLYIQAVGKPGLTNNTSPGGVQYIVP